MASMLMRTGAIAFLCVSGMSEKMYSHNNIMDIVPTTKLRYLRVTFYLNIIMRARIMDRLYF